MSTNLNTLKNSELFDIFEKAEKFNAYGALHFRLRNELWERAGKEGSESDFDNAALVLSKELFRAANKAEKIRFLRTVHHVWIGYHDFE